MKGRGDQGTAAGSGVFTVDGAAVFIPSGGLQHPRPTVGASES